MQVLSEGVFISIANFTLARRDSYLQYLHAGVNQDTLTALRTAPVHLYSLFPDQLITNLANLTDIQADFILMLPVTDLLANQSGSPVI